jgi:hypothetical protein
LNILREAEVGVVVVIEALEVDTKEAITPNEEMDTSPEEGATITTTTTTAAETTTILEVVVKATRTTTTEVAVTDKATKEITIEEATRGTMIEVKEESTEGASTPITVVVVASVAEAMCHGAKTLKPSVMLLMNSLLNLMTEVVVVLATVEGIKATVEAVTKVTTVVEITITTGRIRIIEERNNLALRVLEGSTTLKKRHLLKTQIELTC